MFPFIVIIINYKYLLLLSKLFTTNNVCYQKQKEHTITSQIQSISICNCRCSLVFTKILLKCALFFIILSKIICPIFAL